MRSALVVTAVFLATATLSGPLDAQVGAGRDSVDRTTIIAGEQYGAGTLHRFFFGSHYRDLWTTPIAVEVLDMQKVGGGLTPTTAGGGAQTKSLRFRGNDGQQYAFRSVDKDPSVPRPELQGTIVEYIYRDQTSSAHPAAPAVAAVLMRATDILHAAPRLVVLPDDPALREFRERFAGTLGFFEERAISEHATPFLGASEIIDGHELFERVTAGPDQIDTRGFLTARLLDLLIGDWDRHQGQWGWARFGDEDVRHWVPIPEDRDYALVRYDGLLPALGRLATPRLTSFGDRYPNMVGLVWNGQVVDRHFLMELDKSTWDSIATFLETRLTDSVMGAAVAAMPREYRRLDSLRLVRTLMERRDRLPQAARAFYRMLAREATLHGTDRADVATIDRQGDGSVDVTLASGAFASGATRVRRRFDPDETSEIRLFLHGGDDRVVIRGDEPRITLRIIAGSGSDIVNDSSGAGGVHFYTSDGDRVTGLQGVRVDRRSYQAPPRASRNHPPYRDWGNRWQALVLGSMSPDVGLFLGAGVYRKHFGFRHFPYASRIRVDGGYAAGAKTLRTGILAHVRRSNSRSYFRLAAAASGIDVVRFHGFGNESTILDPDDSQFYSVNQVQYAVDATMVFSLARSAALALGPTLMYSSTKDRPGRYLASVPDLYGSGEFGQVGGHAELRFDTRDVPAAATRGVLLVLGGAVTPRVWDVDSTTFGEVHGLATTYLSATRAPLSPTLALRVGGKQVFGTYPFQEAAFIGDASTVRLGRQNRFAGDAAAYGSAELRLTLGRILLLLPGHIGIFGLGDVGRVFLDGESSNKWHWAAGGGVWLSFLNSANTVSVALAKSEERLGIYASAGFAF